MTPYLEDVDPALRDLLEHAGDRWGPLGVALTASQMTDLETLQAHLQRAYDDTPRAVEPQEDEAVAEIVALVEEAFHVRGGVLDPSWRRVITRRVRNALVEAFTDGRHNAVDFRLAGPELEPLARLDQSDESGDAMTVRFNASEEA